MSSIKLLLVARQEASDLEDHPQVGPLLKAGWTVAGTAHRIVEPGQPCLLLTLTRDVAVRRPAA